MANRDLLVVHKWADDDASAMQEAIEHLNTLLNGVENIGNSALATEVIDLNRYRIYHNYSAVVQHLQQRHQKPFVFLVNRN